MLKKIGRSHLACIVYGKGMVREPRVHRAEERTGCTCVSFFAYPLLMLMAKYRHAAVRYGKVPVQ